MGRLKTKAINSEIKYFSFRNMPKLKDNVSYHTYNTNQIIFYEGHMPYGIFILTSGEIEIKYGNSKIEQVSSPAFLGISAFMNNTGYSGTAKALSVCDIYFLSTTAYKDLSKKRNSITHWLNK